MSSVPDNWVIPENRAMSLRPAILGLPHVFATLLITTCLYLAMIFDLYGAALFLYFFGYGIGRLVLMYDPFAWELLARQILIPHVMRP